MVQSVGTLPQMGEEVAASLIHFLTWAVASSPIDRKLSFEMEDLSPLNNALTIP
jgi:hypothetical protein